MQSSRGELFRTAVIDFQILNHDSKTRERYSAQYAGNDILLTRKKPALRAEDQTLPAAPFTFSDHRVLLTADGNEWSYIDGNAFVQLYDSTSGVLEPGALFDVRTVDVHPRPEYDTRSSFGPSRFRETLFLGQSPVFSVLDETEGTVLVSAEAEGRSYSWRLDPQKDWYPVYVQMSRDIENYGLVVDEIVSTPQQVDGRWFPREVRYYHDGHLERTLSVQHAAFDQPHHPPRLLVGDSLGMLVGTNVQHHSEGGWVGVPEMFDGVGAALVKEVSAREAQGELDLTPFRQMVKRNNLSPPGCFPRMHPRSTTYSPILLMRQPRLWEEYTRDFIAVHGLDADQTKRAWDILYSCREPAYESLYRTSNTRRDIEKHRADQRSIMRSPDSSDEGRDLARRKIERLDEDEQRLLAPIGRIFEDCLKRRLLALLTPEQQKAADESVKREEEARQPTSNTR